MSSPLVPHGLATRLRAIVILCSLLALAAPGRASPPSAHYPGRWTPTSSPPWPAIAVHLMLVRDTTDSAHHSRILWWNSEDEVNFHGGLWGWNPSDADACNAFPSGSSFEAITGFQPPGDATHSPYDPFCGASVQTGQGVMVVGGTEHGEVGVTYTQRFDPNNHTTMWSSVGDMSEARWYANAVELPSGNVMTSSGSRYVHMVEFGGRPPGGTAPTSFLRRLGLPLAGHWDSTITTRIPGGNWPPPLEGATFTRGWLFGGRDNNHQPTFSTYQLSRYDQTTAGDYGYSFPSVSVNLNTTQQHAIARADHSALDLSYAPGDGGMLVYAGIGSNGLLLSDAWRLYLVPNTGQYTWSQLTLADDPTNGNPGQRYGQVAFIDTLRHRMIMFGGADSSGSPSDNSVWALDLDNLGGPCQWSKPEVVTSNGTPAALVGAALALDPRLETRDSVPLPGTSIAKGQCAYMFGGRTGSTTSSATRDIWQLWVSSTKSDTRVEWVKLNGAGAPNPSTGTAPSARAWASAVYDQTNQRIVFFGGEDATASASAGLEVFGLDLGFHNGDVIPSNWTYDWNSIQSLQSLGESDGVSHGAAYFSSYVFARNSEIDDETTNPPAWTRAGTGIHHLDPWYPFMMVLPNGKVFDAGSGTSSDGYASSILDLGQNTWTTFPAHTDTSNDFEAGSAAMYRPGLIMKTGSREISKGVDCLKTTTQIDMTAANPHWAPGANTMAFGRINHNLVILPTGEVLVVGGTSRYVDTETDFWQYGVRRPEIWDPTYVDPATGLRGYWYGAPNPSAPNDTLASSHIPRDYHGTAILLPDGRVLQAGGNTYPPASVEPYAKEAEIYCPPYLFNPDGTPAARPAYDPATTAPTHLSYGTHYSICVSTGTSMADLDSVVLIKPGAATHGFDMDQRFIRLATDAWCGMGYDVEFDAPAHAGIAPPGDYLMFLVYKKDPAHGRYGTPSLARWVRLGPQSDAPVVCQACSGGGCPVAETRTPTGWITENTILARSADGTETDDALRLAHLPAAGDGRLTLRIRENEHELTTLDRVRLAVIDHPPGTEVFASGARTLVGVREGAYRVTTSHGEDITRLVSGAPSAPGWMGQPGDIVTVEMDGPVRVHRPGTEAGVGAIMAGLKQGPSGGGGAALRPTGASTNRDTPWLDQTGILVQLPDGAGGWRELSHQYPREQPDAALVDSLAHGTYRLVFVGRHRLGFLGRIVPVTAGVTTATLSPLSAVHTRLGDVLAATTGNGTRTNLAPGDTLTLSFAAPEPGEGMVRDVVLLTHGVYTSNLSDRPDLGDRPALPQRFALEQNVPNPFSGTTVIRFALPTASQVRIELFDLLGRRIRTLTDARWAAGYHQVEWDRRDDLGHVLHSGVFMYRMVAGSFRDHRKLVILGD